MNFENAQEYIDFFNKTDVYSHKLGYKLVRLEGEECFYEIDVDASLFNPNKNLHGGALFSVMDSSHGALFHWLIDRDLFYGVTAAANISYKKPISGPMKLTIHAYLEKKTRRIWHIVAKALDPEGTLIATLESKWLILKRSL